MTAPERVSVPDGDGGWIGVTVVRDHEGQWTTVFGDTATAPVTFTPDTGPRMNVASNCAVLQNAFNPGAEGAAVATRHLLHANAAELTLGYFLRPNPGFGAAATTKLRAWARKPGAAWTPLTFDGAAEVQAPTSQDHLTIDPVAHKTDHYTDPFQGPFYAGEYLEVLTWSDRVDPASTGDVMGSQGDVRAVYDIGRIEGPPATVASAPASAFAPLLRSTRPSAVIAPTNQKASWAIIGDSNSVNPNQSYAMTAFRDRQLPHIMNGKHGLGHWELLNGWWDFQLGEQLRWADSVYSALLTNDGKAGNVTAMMQQLIDVWTLATETMGVKRWVQATKTPSAARQGDGTLKGTPDGTIAINTWLLDGAPVLNGAPAAVGSTETGVARARVARRDGTVKAGAGSHPVGDGWIADVTWPLEEVPDNAVWKKEFDANDVNHYYQAGHDAQAPALAEALRIMGF